METFYIGKDNASKLLLSNDGVAQDISSLTKVEVRYDGTTYSSEDYADAFDWTTYGEDGYLILKMGLISAITESGMDIAAEIIAYDSDNINGIVWGTFEVEMKDLSEE